MDIGVVIALAATLTVLLVAVNFSGRGVQVIGGLFSPPGLGWPSGVQEDDDLRWRWGDPRHALPGPDPGMPPPTDSAPTPSAPPIEPQPRVMPQR